MKRILITSGPTREYFDPVRFLTNASTGRMGVAVAEAVLNAGHVPVIVSGPVQVQYPGATEVHWVETTQEMLEQCTALFPECIGVIGAAAPCDFRPARFSEQKLKKNHNEKKSFPLLLVETPDILAALGRMKRPGQWSIGFALETHDGVKNALEKMHKKNCDAVVLNAPEAIAGDVAFFRILTGDPPSCRSLHCTKTKLAEALLTCIAEIATIPKN